MIDGRIEFGETHLFVGRGYVVSVRHGPSASYKKVRAHCEASPALLRAGETYILHSILDFIVDNYLPVLERVQDEAEEIENDLLAERLTPRAGRSGSTSCGATCCGCAPACCRWSRSAAGSSIATLSPMDAKMELLFRDVTDHVRSVQEEIDGLREMLAFCFEASLLTSQSQQTMISRRLAAWAAILAVPTAVAGIYGMNFEQHARAAMGERLLCGDRRWSSSPASRST